MMQVLDTGGCTAITWDVEKDGPYEVPLGRLVRLLPGARPEGGRRPLENYPESLLTLVDVGADSLTFLAVGLGDGEIGLEGRSLAVTVRAGEWEAPGRLRALDLCL